MPWTAAISKPNGESSTLSDLATTGVFSGNNPSVCVGHNGFSFQTLGIPGTSVDRPRRAYIDDHPAPSLVYQPTGPIVSAGSQSNQQESLNPYIPPFPTLPKPLPFSSISKIIKQWQDEMGLEKFLRRPCAICSSLTTRSELQRTDSYSLDLSVLKNDDLPEHLQPRSYNFAAYDRAILDPHGMEDLTRRGWINVCCQCYSEVSKSQMPKFALCNWLYYAREHLPMDINEAFNAMSVFEKALICRVRTNSLLCRFTGIDEEPGDNPFSRTKRHIRGNIISTPLELHQTNEVLPPSPRVIADTICAIIISKTLPSKETLESLKPILVRKSRLKLLIEFLIANNPHYRKCESFGGFSSEYLEGLFSGEDDVGIPAAAKIGYLPVNKAVDSLTEDYTGRLDGAEGLFMENVSYTTGDHSSRSYKQMTIRAIEHCMGGRPYLLAQSGSEPVPDIRNPAWLSWAHPTADPFGIGGFHDPRRRKPIGMEQQLKHLLNVHDPFFENDPELAFDIYNIIRKGAVNTAMNFTVPLSAYSKVVTQIGALQTLHITALREQYRRNPAYTPTTLTEQNVLKVMSSIAPMARNIPGSVSQKIKMRNEIRAIISQRGSPTLFITINPDDYNHPIVSTLATRSSKRSQLPAIRSMDSTSRTDLALSHPVACAQFFDAVMNAFAKIILRCGGRASGPGIFGTCDAYYGTVETQGRGTLHCHMLVWLRNHLPPERLTQILKTSPEYGAALKVWIDSIMDSGFVGVRTHSTDYGPDEHPRQPGSQHPASAPEPRIGEMTKENFLLEMNEQVDELLTRFNWHKHNGACWKYLRPSEARSPANCRFGMDGTLYADTTIDTVEGTIQPRRRHPRMTHYNPVITFLLKCNTDIKFIGSGSDAKAFMYYVTDYITKAPLSMHAGLAALSYAIRQGEAKGVLGKGEQRDAENRRAMTIAINSMLGHQEISHPQVMSYILGGGECYTNEKFQAYNWAETVRYVEKFCSVELPEESDIAEVPTTPGHDIGGLSVAVSTSRNNISACNQLLDYIFRPSGEPFASMGLYNHIALTRRVSQGKRRDVNVQNGPGTPQAFSSIEHPQFHTHKLGVRLIAVVPVLLGPKIARRDGTSQERESWARDICILFKPWRHPNELKTALETWIDASEKLLPTLSPNDLAIATNMSLISESKQERDAKPRRKKRGPTDASLLSTEGLPDLDELPEVSPPSTYEIVAAARSGQNNTTLTTAYLEGILGADRVRAIQQCYAPSSTSEAPNHEVDIEAAEGEPSNRGDSWDRDLLTAQKQYMLECRRRPHNGGEGRTRKKKSSPSKRPPDARITSINEPKVAPPRKAAAFGMEDALMLAKSRQMEDNFEQMRAYITVAKHILEGGSQLLMFIGGQGGSGKSYLIDTIVMLFENMGRLDEVRLGAFTGIAASLIGGNTLHSLLSIGSNSRTNLASAKRLSEEWKYVKYLIVDEISMVSAQFMATISSRLKVAKGDDVANSLKNFGGLHVIFLGDFHQLSPPTQPSLFSHRLVRNPSFLETRNNNSIDGFAGAYLWRQVENVVLLKQSKRQEGDPVFARLLELIRHRKCLGPDQRQVLVNGKSVVEHIRDRDLAYVSATNPNSLTSFVDAPVIVGTREMRDSINITLLTAHARRVSAPLHVYHAQDTIKGEKVSDRASTLLWRLPSRLTKDSIALLPMFIGMKVMITENVSVAFKVVNGTEGTITDIQFSEDAAGKRYAEVVYVKLASAAQTIHAPGLPAGVVPIFPTNVNVPYPLRIGSIVSKSFSRRQVPLIPAYSYTDYKSQGRTLSRAVLDLASSQGQGIYVMLSRVRSLDGLLILRWFPQSKIIQEMSGELREEIARLERLDQASRVLFYTSNPDEALRAGRATLLAHPIEDA
ncbi:hypothetical protein D9611_000998 [Ephemerocybe angulata]|uniref:ATP-dependent DNA helicase n=1 Tax=Ephemerocybe angulata TaxID=980116 RepID=A0A8H5BM75_9AGAR|nr:hypothetical protein D9611_000998 [Tulosesus angulatus]